MINVCPTVGNRGWNPTKETEGFPSQMPGEQKHKQYMSSLKLIKDAKVQQAGGKVGQRGIDLAEERDGCSEN